MKSAIITTIMSLTALATAAPADLVRRQSSAVPSYSASSSASYSSGVAVASGSYSSFGVAAPTGGYAAPTGTGAYGMYPTGAGVAPWPMSTGTSCSPNGAVVCNGPHEFGLCNWGKVVFQPVAAGTACHDGMIA